MDELYKQNEKMIKNLSWSFTKKYRLREYEEVFATANLIFCEVVSSKKYDSKRSSFSTYLSNQLHYRLNDWCKDQWTIREKEILCSDNYLLQQTYRENFAQDILFKDMVDKFSAEEKLVINTILNPEKINYAHPKTTKYTLTKELRKKMNPNSIKHSFKNIELALNI